MELSKELKSKYCKEQISALSAQRIAEFIAWGPMVFQASRILINSGILDMIIRSTDGLTRQEIAEATGMSDYAVKCLLEAGLCIGTLLVDTDTDKFTASKVGWFLLNDKATRVNMDFNHDVNYLGLFDLDKSFASGKPEGLKVFGQWPTIYEGLLSLPGQVQKSWFQFDHFYSDASFDQALAIVLDQYHPRVLFDVGGNTGRWATRCVEHDKDVRVVILDLPQQIKLMEEATKDVPGHDRISSYPINLLDENQAFPTDPAPDAIWMSQFLDCFSGEQIVSILKRAKASMKPDSRIFIMETLWDRQRFDTAAFCLTMTSLYFTAMANGNSKMYNTDDMRSYIEEAGLKIEQIHDGLGQGHSIIVCTL